MASGGSPCHDDEAVGEKHRFEDAVRDEDDGPFLVQPQAQEILVELEAGDLVERREGLVEEEETWPGDERAGNRDAHLHAAGELARIGAGKAVEPDRGDRLGDARRGGAAGGPGEAQRQIDVVGDGCPRHQRRLLEDETYGPRAGRAATRGTVGDPARAAARLGKAGDDAKQRALAATRGAEQADEGAAFDGKIDAVERDDAVAEGLTDAVEGDEGRQASSSCRPFY